ncbi:McrB family protein [Ureibacillus sp. GCM10028918]|uniref:McrB family protein n=1 Tax=Ureibacillus sp. GCM10028918 TaxID=3273429 RepID=UPI00360EFC4A
MAYKKGQADKNIEFLTNDLGLSKVVPFNVFIDKDLLVLSPAVQGENEDSGAFDVNLNNILEIRNRMKINQGVKRLLIVRYYDRFLIANLDDFLNKLTDERYLYSPPSRPSTKKWQYNIKNINDNYFIKGKNNKLDLLVFNRDQLLEYVEKYRGDESIQKQSRIEEIQPEDLINNIYKYINSKGFNYTIGNLYNFYLSLRTKPFVIISGISGTGKTKIVQLFAEAIGATEENEQFKLIPVGPDWSDSSELLGYTDIKGDFIKGPLTEIVEQAHQNPDLPHFVLLDEMNLARVEYYFSDVLSVMESRKKVDGEITSSTLVTVEGKPLTLPGNLYIVGTVNMDETTHPFSKKVLDRANTIEFNEIDLMNFDSMTKGEAMDPIGVTNKVLESSFIHLIDAFSTHEQLIREVSEKLVVINKHLQPIHAQVGYRVRDEISFYMAHNEEAGQLLSANDAMDFCIMQKILPRVGGMEAVVRPVLKDLEAELSSYPRSTKKIKEMLERLDTDGFTSFWIS